MKMFALLFASIMAASAFAASDPGVSYEPAKSFCPNSGDEEVISIIEDLDRADQLLPNIPPEEALYLRAEESALRKLLRQMSRTTPDLDRQLYFQRLKNMENRPLYYAWKARNDLASAKKAVAEIIESPPSTTTTYTKNTDAEKLHRALLALSALDSYSRSMQIFLSHVESSNFDVKQWQRLYFATLSPVFDIQGYALCRLAKIMGPQTLRIR